MKSPNHNPQIMLDENGATVVEFAIIAPVFLFLMMGTLDVGYSMYMKSALDGAVQAAARDAALESGPASLATIDNKLKATIASLNDKANVSIDRKSYFDFTDVKRAEVFTDANNDGKCNNGENFEDENANGVWDIDVGEDGVGGPKDVVLYNVSVSYDGLFPFAGYKRKASKRELTGYKTENVPKYKMLVTGTKKVKTPIYESTVQMLPGKREVKVPVYEMIDQGTKTRKIPIYESKIVPRKGAGNGTFKVPIYEYKVVTRTKNKKLVRPDEVKYEYMDLPVYDIYYINKNGKQIMQRKFKKYVKVRIVDQDSLFKDEPYAQQLLVRKLVRYETLSKPTHTIKRVKVGEKELEVKLPPIRKLVRYDIVKKPEKTVVRKITGYKIVDKPTSIRRVPDGYKTIKTPIYKNVDASFEFDAFSGTRVLSSSTVLKNQPYGQKTGNAASVVATCS
ncbi:hypothetical protein LPB140_07955 [Sphingorhabdus lutea]|uniref:TadE-like domain-containing protein n=2 Tax=Sphingorhabdus lutea TaxID=1913578 RepID=A0A1L3JC86_9SPHN|nr:hypothetical protein LPB140_07955 [Sphingorhabdus lutea]